MFLELYMEVSACVLEPSVAMQQWMGIWIVLQGLVQSIQYEPVVVTVTDYVAYDSAIEKIKNGAQVEFSRILSAVELELGYIRNPFLVRTFGMKVSCQDIFSDVLRLGGMARTAVARMLYGRLDLLLAHQAQHTLVADMLTITPIQVIAYTAVALVGMLLIDFQDLLCQPVVCQLTLTLRPVQPVVIGRPGYL